MNKYTIYCTEEQTRKAFELGAPLEINEGKNTVLCRYQKYNTYKRCVIPTTQQMIGWLEEQGTYIIVPIPLIKNFNKKDFSKADAFEYRIVINGSEPYSGEYLTRKEATLAAIDAALEYLTENKK